MYEEPTKISKDYRLPDYTPEATIGDGVQAGFLCGGRFGSSFMRVYEMALEKYEERHRYRKAAPFRDVGRPVKAVGHYSVNRFRVLSKWKDGRGRSIIGGSNPFAAALTSQIFRRMAPHLRVATLRDLPAILAVERQRGVFGLKHVYVDLGLVTVGDDVDALFTIPDSTLPDSFFEEAVAAHEVKRIIGPGSERERRVWDLSGPAGPIGTAVYGRTSKDPLVKRLQASPQYAYAKLAERVLLADMAAKTRQPVQQPSYVPFNKVRFVFGLADIEATETERGLSLAGGDLFFGFAGTAPPVHAPILARSGSFSLDDLDRQTGLPREIVDVESSVFSEGRPGEETDDTGWLVGVGKPGFCRLIYAGSLLGLPNVLVNASPLSLSMTMPSGRIMVVQQDEQ